MMSFQPYFTFSHWNLDMHRARMDTFSNFSYKISREFLNLKVSFRHILTIETTGLRDPFNTKGVGSEEEKGNKGYFLNFKCIF